MFRDNNVPHGFYGEHYAKMTGSKSRKATQPYSPMAQWESDAVEIVLEELNKKLNLNKYERKF